MSHNLANPYSRCQWNNLIGYWLLVYLHISQRRNLQPQMILPTMDLRSNPLHIKAIKYPFGNFFRKVIKMKMLEICFALNTSSSESFLAPKFLRVAAQSHQELCLFTVIFRVRHISYWETSCNIHPLGFLICPLRLYVSPSHTDQLSKPEEGSMKKCVV